MIIMSSSLVAIALLTAAVISTTNAAPIDAPSDRAALVQIYATMSGATWENKTNWNTTASICAWNGVRCTCNASLCRVSALLLPNNKLEGQLPADIGQLGALQLLNLGTNKVPTLHFEYLEFVRFVKYSHTAD